MISAAVRQNILRLRTDFKGASPFKHVVVDDFLESDAAESLLADFPPFAPENAKNEFGAIGGKAAISNIAKISDSYARAYRYFSSSEFLDLVSQITGIPELVSDEKMFGGGTHENLEGQELDPHVDFNYIPDRRLHRRLNLLLYFNKEWEPGWGGCLELHSNPRRPAENSVTTIVPTFNRCVLFETSELSWHGFERITLPDHAKHLSRKLLSIYLYTHDRPAEEIAPPHATFYVQRPMPQHLVPGYTLTPADIQQLHQLFRRRDDWIEFYQREELRFSTRIQELSYLENQFDVPVFGLAAQSSPSRGFWSDNWIGSPFEVSLRTSSPVRLITLQGDLPAQLSKEAEICVWIDGQVLLKQKFKPGRFNIAVRTSIPAGQHLRLKITSDTVYCPAKAGESEDIRELLALLKEIRVS